MLDLHLLSRVRLNPEPPVQRFIGNVFLRFDYRRVEIVLEGTENLPEGKLFFAMNHTDRYNYWPFQWTLYQRYPRYTATWVKGKNYDHPFIAKFMEWTNNIPVASRGYLVVRDFVATMGRKPTNDEYEMLRAAVDRGEAIDPKVPRELIEKPRSMMGHDFDPKRESYPAGIGSLFAKMMDHFTRLNRYALDVGLAVLVFPQGTRSIRLSKGHNGLAQLALHLKTPIVPVGCNGSDLVYPGNSFVAKAPGRIVYRIGKPITLGELAQYDPGAPYVPFSPAAESAHKAKFTQLTERVMHDINGLLDERYQYSEDRSSDGTAGVNRFV